MKHLQVLGTGCPECSQLAAATAPGLEFQLEMVTHLKRIMTFGVMMTPALVVDGTVKCAGRVPKVDERKTLIA